MNGIMNVFENEGGEQAEEIDCKYVECTHEQIKISYKPLPIQKFLSTPNMESNLLL